MSGPQHHLNAIATEAAIIHNEFMPMITDKEEAYKFYCHLDEIIDHVRAVQKCLTLPPLQHGGQPAETN